MRIIDCEQGSQEWFACRRGIPSASEFDKVVTTEGKLSKQSQKYMYRLVGEIVSGTNEETYTNGNMERGKQLEAEARQLFEMVTDQKVNQVGFCVTEGKTNYGCSPDGLIGDDGGLELKNPSMAVHVGYLVNGVLPTEYYQQVMGSLLVTKRKWWAFMSHYPGLPPFILKVEPDVKFLKALHEQLEIFCAELDQTVKKITKG